MFAYYILWTNRRVVKNFEKLGKFFKKSSKGRFFRQLQHRKRPKISFSQTDFGASVYYRFSINNLLLFEREIED